MNLELGMVSLEGGQARRHAFFDDVLFGMRTRADAGNVDLLLLTGLSAQVTGEPTHYFDLCRAHGAEGLILCAFLPDEPELPALVSSGFPCVAIDTQLFGPRAGFVSSDSVGGAAAAVRHLAELGRKRIAYIGAWGPEPANIDRRLGYESALGEFGLELREKYVMLAGWSHARAYELTKKTLALPEPPDAFFCASDLMAIGAIKAIEEAGLRVPEDIAVAGFDDSDYAAISVPSLTSVRQDRVGLGTAAVEAILRILDEPQSPPPSIVLSVELVLRESTGARLEQGQGVRDSAAVGPAIGAPTPRLSAAALYGLLGEINDPPLDGFRRSLAGASASGVAPGETPPRGARHRHGARPELPPRLLRRALLRNSRARVRARSRSARDHEQSGPIPGAPFPPFLELCARHRADGIIVASLPLEEPTIAELAASDFPCVMLDVDLLSDRIAFVMSDNVGGAVELTRHLIETGRRRIAFIGGRGDERPTVDRRFGYQSELARWNLPCRAEYVAMARWLPGARPSRRLGRSWRCPSRPTPSSAPAT